MAELVDAVRRGDHAYVQTKLLNERSNVRFLVHKEELLNTAASFGHVDVVQLLLSNDLASLSQRSRTTQRTALHEACASGSADIVGLLLERLVKGGAGEDFLDTGDREGMTPVHVAASHGELDCLRLLADAEANLVMSDRRGMQPVHWAAQRDHPEVVRFLYKRGVDIEAACGARKTPAHYAAQFGSLRALKALVERNCDLSLGDARRNQPVHLAAGRNHTDCLRFIVAQGVGKEVAREDGKRPLHLAAQHDAKNALHWLLETGADPNAEDKAGNTPGHYANESGNAAIYNCLLHHGADTERENKNGEKHCHSARRSGHPIEMGKALSNEVACEFCTQRHNRFTWEQRHIAAPVRQAIETSAKTAYTTPLGSYQRDMKRKEKQARQRRQATRDQGSQLFMTEMESARPSARDLTAKYYGDFVDAV